jgi:hypothetical protein
MGTAFATGHAAGVAAALTADNGDARTAAVRAEVNRQERAPHCRPTDAKPTRWIEPRGLTMWPMRAALYPVAALQDALALGEPGLLEHHGHDGGLGCRADLVSVGVLLGVDRVVGVGGFQRHLGDEVVAADGRMAASTAALRTTSRSRSWSTSAARRWSGFMVASMGAHPTDRAPSPTELPTR